MNQSVSQANGSLP